MYLPPSDPFVYNYERLRIGGLVCAGLIIAGGIGIVVYNQCSKRPSRKSHNDSDI